MGATGPIGTMATSTATKRQILPPHEPPADAAKFLESLTDSERKLHELAMTYEGLGSSYFMEKSHSYKKWKSSQGKK